MGYRIMDSWHFDAKELTPAEIEKTHYCEYHYDFDSFADMCEFLIENKKGCRGTINVNNDFDEVKENVLVHHGVKIDSHFTYKTHVFMTMARFFIYVGEMNKL